jgi:hypothetical protein
MVADLRLLPSSARRALTLSLRLTFPIPKAPLSIEPFLGGKSLAETRGRTESLQQYAGFFALVSHKQGARRVMV